MKKLSVLALTTAMVALTVCGCAGKDASADQASASTGSEETNGKYLSEINSLDYVTLGDYKGISVDVDKITIEDSEIDEYIDYVLSQRTTTEPITDRTTVQSGDVANIDYEGKKDGVAFEGGTAQGYDLEIGSGTFIPGFEDGLIGKEVGETVDLDITFPEGYNEELGGKAVVFTVKINSIGQKVTPELTDELVKELDPAATNISEYRENLKVELKESKEQSREDQIINQLQQKVQANAQFQPAPAGFVDRIYTSIIDTLNQMAESYQVEPAMVAQMYYGVGGENYEAELRTYAEDTIVKAYLLVDAIAETENIVISDEEVDKDIETMIKDYNSETTLEEFKANKDEYEARREYLLMMKILDFMRENAVVNEK